MLTKLRISQKFFLSFVFITVAPLLTVSYLNYSNSKYQLEQKIINAFSALNNARAGNINNLIQLRLEQARQLAGSFLTRQLSEKTVDEPWLVHKMQGHFESVFDELKRRSQSTYRDIGRVSDVESIGLLDSGGTIIANTDKGLIGKKIGQKELDFVKQSGTYFGGLQKDAQSQQAFLTILDAVRHWDTGRFSGAVLIRVKGDILNNITNDRTGLGQSGESYIINRDGLMMTGSRFEQNAAFRLKIDTPASRGCFSGGEVPPIYSGYRHGSVLGVVQYMPDQDWCMVSEMDTQEAFASVEQLQRLMLGLTAAVIVLILFFLAFMNKVFIKPIVELRDASQQVGGGNFNVRVEPRSQDELGELTKVFNKMTVDLKEDKAKLEEQKRDLEKVNKELDSFVYTASHDLRAPLRGIAAFASFLEDDYKDKLGKEGMDHVKEIHQGAERLNALIEDLLLLSRISRVKNPHEQADITNIVNQAAQQLKYDITSKNVKLVVAGGLPVILCDPIKIKTVFLNLINNAVKFSAKQNKVQARVEIGYNNTPNAHQFSVKDNGIGIAPEFHEKVFGLFRKLHPAGEYDGTGAGLSIVQNIVEEHGGRIWIESKEGSGAVFYFTIDKNLGASQDG